MSTFIRCDGCSEELKTADVAIDGRRANGMLGGGLPNGEYHLCRKCAVIGFSAIFEGATEEWRVVKFEDGIPEILWQGASQSEADHKKLTLARRTERVEIQVRIATRWRVAS